MATYDAIAGVTITERHVFIIAPPEVLIVPRDTFPDRQQMAAFGDEIDRLSHESAP